MNAILVYYPFPLMKTNDSGSKVRPSNMINGFKEWGEDIEVYVIEGTSKERKEAFNKLEKSGKLNNVWFCYMEFQTIPFWLTDPNHLPLRPFLEISVMRKLKSLNIPLGIFYRDVYWKFDEFYKPDIKSKIVRFLHRLEEKILNQFSDVVFVPSEEIKEYVNVDKPMYSLPPAGEIKSFIKTKSHIPNGIYVGGITSKQYALSLLLSAYELLNEKNIKSQLTIICRSFEYNKLSSYMRKKLDKPYISVHHASGEDLNSFYQHADFGFVPLSKSTYGDFAVAVKIFEYLSFHLPIIATDCKAQSRIIKADRIGIIAEHTPESLKAAIEQMIEQKSYYAMEIPKVFEQKHTWKRRAEEVKLALIDKYIE